MATAKITNYFLENAKCSQNSEREIFWDTELSKFGVRVGQKSKTFICEHRVGNKNVRVTLGKFPAMSVSDARKKAISAFAEMSYGKDINAEKKVKKVESVTLGDAYASYKDSRELRSATLVQYEVAMMQRYGDWLEKPIQLITKDMVEERHKQFADEYSGLSANKYTRTLRSVLNYAIAKYEVNDTPIISVNPVKRISATRGWFRSKRKTGHLKQHQIIKVLEEIEAVKNPVIADYIRFVIFTGCRRREVTTLRWDQIDLKNRSFFVEGQKVKNHDKLELPLSSYLMDVISRRYIYKENDYVFPSPLSRSGHIEEPKKVVIAIGKKIEHHFTLHDLRRTFITIAESLDISAYALKALVNHRLNSQDVTSGYVIMNVERLREPMQRITDFILTGKDSK